MIDLRELVEQPMMQALAWTLLHFLWQGAALGLLAFVLLRIVRPRLASTRYAIGVTTLALMLGSCATTFIALAQQPVGTESGTAPEPTPTSTPQSSGVTGWVIADLSASPSARALLTAPADTTPLRPQPLAPLSLLLIVATWSAGVLALSFRLLGGWILTRQLARRAVHAVSPSIEAAAEQIAERLRLTRAVAILQSGAVAVPTLVGWAKPVVLLPAAALAGLSPQQLQAILAHELAHVRRHDYLINLLQSIVETLLFYHPATWWVSAKVREEREHCCDDLAVDVCGDRLLYVSALAELTTLATHRGFALAATDGSLSDRVRRILGSQRQAHEPPPAWTALALLALLIVSAGTFGTASTEQSTSGTDIELIEAQLPPTPPLPPPPPIDWLPLDEPPLPPPPPPIAWDPVEAPPLPPAPPVSLSAPLPPPPPAWPMGDLQVPPPPAPAPAMTPAPPAPPPPPAPDAKGSGNFTWNTDNEKISFKWTGPFRLTDDERDIAWIEEGAAITISDGLILADRVDLKGVSGGRIERTFSKNGFKRDYEPEGRLFVANALDKIIRRSGMFARDRIARFLKQGGADAVLAEIDRLESSYVKRVYYTELLRQSPVNESLLSRVLERVPRDLTTDYDRSTTLAWIVGMSGVTDAHRASVARAAKSIKSDYEQRRVLSAVLATTPIAASVAGAILDATTTVESSHERSAILSALARKGGVTPAIAPAFMDLVRSMPSSYEQRRVLSVVATQPALADSVMLDAVKAAGSIQNSHEQALTLLALVERDGLNDASAESFFASLAKLGSTYERTRVLRAVIGRGNLSERLLTGVLRAAGALSGDHDRATLLVDLAGRYSLSGQARDLYIAAARGISSELYENRALAALVRAERQ